MNPFSQREIIAKRIRAVLLRYCPALDYRWDKMNNRKFVWFEAHCLAQKVLGHEGYAYRPCSCIRDVTNTCQFGTWPQLYPYMKEIQDFHENEAKKEEKRKERERMLESDVLIPKIKEAMRIGTKNETVT